MDVFRIVSFRFREKSPQRESPDCRTRIRGAVFFLAVGGRVCLVMLAVGSPLGPVAQAGAVASVSALTGGHPEEERDDGDDDQCCLPLGHFFRLPVALRALVHDFWFLLIPSARCSDGVTGRVLSAVAGSVATVSHCSSPRVPIDKRVERYH